MAYARYGPHCDWYIFRYSAGEDAERHPPMGAGPATDETLAVWHAHHRADAPLFTSAEVAEMVRTGDYSRIPGFTETERELVARSLGAFISDVDHESA